MHGDQSHEKHVVRGRVLIQDELGQIDEASFDTSIFRFFGMESNVFSFTCNVAVHLTEKRIILLHKSLVDPNNFVEDENGWVQQLKREGYSIETTIPLGRALKCPMFDFHLWPEEERVKVIEELNSRRMVRSQPPIKHCSLAVSVLIENADTGRVLITRRAKHMRSFPCVWVTPGGSIDETDHSLLATAQREVWEETGVTVNMDNIELYCMWESVFPHYLSMGTPSHHHVILYYRAVVQVDETHIKMQEEEVDAYAWLDPVFVQSLLEQENEGTFRAFEHVMCDVAHEPKIHERDFHISRLNNIDALERVSEGTNFALAQWCQRKSGKAIVAELNQ